MRVMVIEPGAVATELTGDITHPGARQAAEQMYQQLAIVAEDIADVIAFAVPPAESSHATDAGGSTGCSDQHVAGATQGVTRQTGRTFSACGPFCPWVVSNSTFWFSSSDL